MNDNRDGCGPMTLDAESMRQANEFAGVQVFTQATIARAAGIAPRPCDVQERALWERMLARGTQQ